VKDALGYIKISTPRVSSFELVCALGPPFSSRGRDQRQGNAGEVNPPTLRLVSFPLRRDDHHHHRRE
jgi:hypothetical protein